MVRLLIVIFILLPLCWFLKMDAIALVLFLGIIIIPIIHFIKCYFYRNNKKYKDRSLSFGFKSIRSQIKEFEFINHLVFLPIKFRVFLKRFSIVNDALFEHKADRRDYFGDPAYSISVTNMYHDHKSR